MVSIRDDVRIAIKAKERSDVREIHFNRRQHNRRCGAQAGAVDQSLRIFSSQYRIGSGARDPPRQSRVTGSLVMALRCNEVCCGQQVLQIRDPVSSPVLTA